MALPEWTLEARVIRAMNATTNPCDKIMVTMLPLSYFRRMCMQKVSQD
jgi:hypothetical protein